MTEEEIGKLHAFFAEKDAEGVSNLEKASTRSKILRRVATTSKDKSVEDARPDAEASAYPVGVVVENGKLIGLGIHIFNEDVYPLQSFEIYLRGCDLCGRLDLDGCDDMVFLDLYNNRISAVNLGSMKAMRILGLQNNALSELDVSGLPSVQGIDVGKNRIAGLQVSANPELVELYVNDNAMTEIDLSHNPKLKYFYCHRNGMTTLDTTHNPLLRHLNATENPLREIRALTPQRESPLPLTLRADDGGYVGLKFNPVYNAQWKETGEWQQSYEAYPMEGFHFAGWYDEMGRLASEQARWIDEYGASRRLTARFRR